MKFGAHMSIAGGVDRAFALGEQAGCDTLQIFSKNQQQWRARPLGEQEIARFKAEQQRTGFGPIIVHDSYLINLASPDEQLWEKSITAFRDELERCATLGIPYLVTHPGAHTGSGEQAGLEREALALNQIFERGVGEGVTVLLETTAGQGTTLGYRFEQLAWLIGAVRQSERLAICIDTCHLLAAGYDIRTPEAYTATMATFDQLIGIARVKVVHVNDSQRELGSRIDRHTHIGAGAIGLEGFRALVNDARLAQVPMILETPKGDDLAEDIANLAQLRGLIASPEQP